jgi:ABC-2 type transport system permease protein
MKNYIFLEYFRNKLREYIEYPFNFMVGVIWLFIGLIPLYFFWGIIIGQGILTTYSFEKMFLYFLFVFGLYHTAFFYPWLAEEILSGKILKILVRKISVERHFIYSIITSTLLDRLGNIILILVAGLYFVGFNVILALIVYFFGLLLASIIYSILFSMSFWTGKTWGLGAGLSLIIELAAGSWLPLDLFPQQIQNIVYYLPFKFMFFIPGKIFLGDISITFELILQYLIWLIVLVLILKIVMKKGLKRYEQLGE